MAAIRNLPDTTWQPALPRATETTVAVVWPSSLSLGGLPHCCRRGRTRDSTPKGPQIASSFHSKHASSMSLRTTLTQKEPSDRHRSGGPPVGEGGGSICKPKAICWKGVREKSQVSWKPGRLRGVLCEAEGTVGPLLTDGLPCCLLRSSLLAPGG